MKNYRQLSTSRAWCYLSYGCAALVLAPILTVFSSWLLPLSEHWDHIFSNLLGKLVWNSILLLIGVCLGTSSLGIGLAWIISQYQFPGRDFFRKALLSPLAIPGYVVAFAYLGVLDFSGPVFSFLRSIGYQNFYDFRNVFGVCTVLSLTLFPYVYLLSRQAFESQDSSLMEAARSLGSSRQSILFRLALPMARPWIFGALCLVMMETLADFGTVSILGFSTFTTAIYKAWFGFFSPTTAAQLSTGLLFFIAVIFLIEKKQRKNKSYTTGFRKISLKKPKFRKTALLFSVVCASVFFISFVVPVIQLVVWAIDSWGNYHEHLWILALNSFILGLLTSIVVCFVCLLLIFGLRFFPIPKMQLANRISLLGYTIPGSVLAIGVFLPLVNLDHLLANTVLAITGWDPGLFLSGSLFTVVLGLTIRFLAVGHSSISAAQERVSQRIDEAAINFGVYGFAQFQNIHFPIIWKSFVGAFVLVFIDTIKEMPLTLMTRPFGWDTLSVRIFELISEGEWESAAVPALVLVLLGFIPVLLFQKEKS